jgi:hypothetical protein
MKCHVCGKALKEKEGFVSNVNAEGRTLKKGESPVAVCGEQCKHSFTKSLPLNGQPLAHMSRVTGYVQNVSNWNKGKQQEFRDRVRYSLGNL